MKNDTAFKKTGLLTALLWLGAPASAVFSSDQIPVQTELDRPTGSIEILDDAALELIDPSAEVHIRAEGYAWSEGPLWIEEGGFLLFSDVPNNVIHRYDPGVGTCLYLENSGANRIQPTDTAEGSNGLLLNSEGQLVLMQHGDRRVSAMTAPLADPKAEFFTLAREYDGKRLNSPNDGVFHSNGSLYFTDPPYGRAKGLDEGELLSFHGIYRLDPDETLHLLDDSVRYPNGIGFSADEETLYVAVSDSEKPEWLAYDVQPDGDLTGKRIFHDASGLRGLEGEPGLPDGLAVHSNGTVFATGPGGVWMFSPAGKLLAKIRTGKATANCTLSSDEKTLYMTAHDTLMTVSLKPATNPSKKAPQSGRVEFPDS